MLKLWVGSWNMGAKPFKDEGRRDVPAILPTDYHIYVFGVQECVNNDFFNYLGAFFKHHKIERLPVSARVTGRGDGSFLYPKFTGEYFSVLQRDVKKGEREKRRERGR